MEVIFTAIANILAVSHAYWLAFLAFCTILAVFGILHKNKKILTAYGSAVAFTGFSNAIFGFCLLTFFENLFRRASDADYLGSFTAHYLSSVGFQISGVTIFYIINGVFLVGLFSTFIWLLFDRKFIPSYTLRFAVLVTAAFFIALIPQFKTHAGGGGGGINCTGLVDLNTELVDSGIIEEIPTDPTGVSTNGSGYFISSDSKGAVTVSAPSAEQGLTIELTR